MEASRRLFLFIAFALSFLMVGCGKKETIKKSERTTSIVSTQEMIFHGNRVFVLQILDSEVDGDPFQTLQVIGDGIAISFHASGGPHTPSVSGNEIEYGGHRLEVQATPNSFSVDGQSHTLDSPGAYAFSEGEFLGRVW